MSEGINWSKEPYQKEIEKAFLDVIKLNKEYSEFLPKFDLDLRYYHFQGGDGAVSITYKFSSASVQISVRPKEVEIRSYMTGGFSSKDRKNVKLKPVRKISDMSELTLEDLQKTYKKYSSTINEYLNEVMGAWVRSRDAERNWYKDRQPWKSSGVGNQV
jgi:hypothetical protein